MPGIVEYIKKFGTETMKERSFSTEDALVLCQFSYLKFDNLLETMSREPVSVKNLFEDPNSESLFLDDKYKRDRKKQLKNMVESKRFSDIKLMFYVNRIEAPNQLNDETQNVLPEKTQSMISEKAQDETQFCAVTFEIPDYGYFIAFRGTDETIVGWQEDFRLALAKPVKGQKLSAKYINEVASKLEGTISVGGHSKGGNLALYSTMHADAKVLDRIEKIYSFDGPGFRPELLKEYNYEAIREKVVSVIPKSSVVGLLMSTDSKTIVVHANSIGPMQHNPYTWLLKRGRFSTAEVTQTHLTLVNAFNDWVYSLDEEQAKRFVHVLEEILAATGAETTLQISAELVKSARNVFKRSQELDEESEQFLEFLLSSYYELTKDRLKAEFTEKIDSIGKDAKSFIDGFGEDAKLKLAELGEKAQEAVASGRKKH
ncbi:MAG: DUF2974 domain-containing protein [Lachnospiraceae bacterium]|nr:DUF2974 domain-containing protein [Lachnospiraceae bacterium]